jgi:integrase
MSADETRRLLSVARDLVEAEQRARRRTSRRAERDYLLIVLALNAGLRASELAGLLVGHLRLADKPPRLIVVGGKARASDDVDEVELRYDVARLLQGWVEGRSPDEPVFPSERKRRPLTARGVWGVVKKLLRQAGLNSRYSTHTLRHRFIGAEVEAQERKGKIDPYLIARRARHRTVEPAMHYVHFRDSVLREHLDARESEL